MKRVLLGGLGGGGDVGLALVLSQLLVGVEVVYASFARCSPGKYEGVRVAGALFVPARYHPRDFEWALHTLMPGTPVYRICVKAAREEVMEALEWLHREYGPVCSLHADIGGDGLLTGFEEGLGSYTTDTLARAALVEASSWYGWRSLLAVGGLQLEGGNRRALRLDEQVADLLYYKEKGALLGVVEPPGEAAALARALLNPGREMVSVMLPLYLASLEGRRKAVVARGYSTGVHRIDWWARYVFLLDNKKACMASPLCSAARVKWLEGLRRWRRPSPAKDYLFALRQAKGNPEKKLRSLIEALPRLTGLTDICLRPVTSE